MELCGPPQPIGDEDEINRVRSRQPLDFTSPPTAREALAVALASAISMAAGITTGSTHTPEEIKQHALEAVQETEQRAKQQAEQWADQSAEQRAKRQARRQAEQRQEHPEKRQEKRRMVQWPDQETWGPDEDRTGHPAVLSSVALEPTTERMRPCTLSRRIAATARRILAVSTGRGIDAHSAFELQICANSLAECADSVDACISSIVSDTVECTRHAELGGFGIPFRSAAVAAAESASLDVVSAVVSGRVDTNECADLMEMSCVLPPEDVSVVASVLEFSESSRYSNK